MNTVWVVLTTERCCGTDFPATPNAWVFATEEKADRFVKKYLKEKLTMGVHRTAMCLERSVK